MPGFPRAYQSDAIVLRRTDLGEADRVVTVFSRTQGKYRVVAKGVRRTTSKLGGHLELFTHSRLLVARGRTLDIVTQAETVDPFLGLRDDVFRATFACYAAELLDRLTPEHSPDPEAFELLLTTLRRVSQDQHPEMAVRYFELTLFGHLGYRPHLLNCASCQKTLGPVGNSFSDGAGGVLCPDCGQLDRSSRPITTNAFKVLRLLQAGDYATASRLTIDESLRAEAERVLLGYAEYIIERHVKSAEFLASLRSGVQ